MYRRVGVPILLAAGVWAGLTALGLAATMLTRSTMNHLSSGEPGWLPPILPLGSWVTFLVIFAAMHMCARRGGSRRECILVGLSPLAAGLVFYGYVLFQFPASVIPTFVGSTAPYLTGGLDLGSLIAAREYASDLLGLAALCITATWLYLWVGKATLSPEAKPA